jgi:exodeoxyribonuclease VII large subunit
MEINKTTEHPIIEELDHNLPVLTVGEISQALKRHIEHGFAQVRVRGEISGFKRAPSGHVYLSLKDENAVLAGVCWRSAASRIGIAPEDGMDVIVTGRLTTYPGRSQYQLVIESIELAGEGALLKLLEDRKKKLAAEGLFDPALKKPIPYLPTVIGVVTSPTGAVIRDILHRLSDRFPRHVLLWPVIVQGEGASEQIAAAIQGFNNLPRDGAVPRPDLLIVARGGGSIEDLWAFNEEAVVRAAAASAIPLISAIGHETDTTLIDFAADRRAPTPTAAAEMAVPVRLDLLAQVMMTGTRIVGAITRNTGERRTRLEGLARALPKPRRLVDEARQRLDDWQERLRNSLVVGLDRRVRSVAQLSARVVAPKHRIVHERSRVVGEFRALASATKAIVHQNRTRFEHAGALLESTSFMKVLERGFVLVRNAEGNSLTRAKDAKPGMAVGLRFHDGERAATVTGSAPQRPATKRFPRSSDDDQGSLL